MKKLLIIPVALIILTLGIIAHEEDNLHPDLPPFTLGIGNISQNRQLFDVRCPNCLNKDTLVGVVGSNGGYSTNINGIPGNMQQMNASFHCPKCHYEFMSQIKPDQFVPTMPAVSIKRSPKDPRMPDPTQPPGSTNTVPDTASYELLRRIPLPDGTEYIVYHRIPRFLQHLEVQTQSQAQAQPQPEAQPKQ